MSDCIWSWVSRDGVKGMQVLGPNGNYIFLPAAGCYYGGNTPEDLNLSGGYWCNSLGIPFWGPAYASCADFGLNQSVSQKNAIRYRGLSIRPVIVALKYRGWDSDGAYLSMFLNQANKTYEIYISSSEADQNLEVFSKGTYSISNEGTTMICNDDEGFSFDIAVDGNRLTFHNGKLGFQAYSFELEKIQL